MISPSAIAFMTVLAVTLELSYRALAADYTSNSDNFGVDLVLHGPAVAAIFTFWD